LFFKGVGSECATAVLGDRERQAEAEAEDDKNEGLDEDDLDLLAENTGGRIARSKLTRLRRGRESGDEGPSRRRGLDDSSDSGIDEANIIGVREVTDIQNIWEDDRGVRDDDDDMDMDDFIADEDEEEEGAGAMAEEEREERRREKRRLAMERRQMLKGRPELTGIDAAYVVWSPFAFHMV
jgi:transcription elongation factor SPT6